MSLNAVLGRIGRTHDARHYLQRSLAAISEHKHGFRCLVPIEEPPPGPPKSGQVAVFTNCTLGYISEGNHFHIARSDVPMPRVIRRRSCRGAVRSGTGAMREKEG